MHLDYEHIEGIARVCHEANRAYCVSLGDHTQRPWEDAEEWQRDSAITGVKVAIALAPTPREQHEAWTADKRAQGWTHGAVKDPEAKTHPCLVPYDELSPEQKLKDALFVGIVRALAPTMEAAR